jgi:hypothetical protein
MGRPWQTSWYFVLADPFNHCHPFDRREDLIGVDILMCGRGDLLWLSVQNSRSPAPRMQFLVRETSARRSEG